MSLSKTLLILCSVLAQPRKICPDMTGKNVDWDVKNQNKQITKYESGRVLDFKATLN